MNDRNVLIVESDLDQRRRVVAQLQHWGYTPVAVTSAEEALETVGRLRFAFSLVAIRLPGMSGIEFLRRAQGLTDSGPVVMVADSAHSSQIVEAIQAGADDFLRRPYTAEDLENAIKGLAGRAPRQTSASPAAVDENGARLERELGLLISPQMREIQAIIEQAARADVTVLICGETGVGKELVARAIHAHSPRRRAPFVKVNCAAVPRELLESELFGHERGAFTGAHQRKPGRFETADGGTIFLDEIGELHPALQAKLLHVLQDGEFSRVGGRNNITVDVRVICATNRDLAREVGTGRFREDLFYRLNVINILVPPLRERREEIPGLVRYFVQRYARLFNFPEPEIPPEAMEAFVQHAWPGNIRELENFIKRMIVLRDMALPRTLVTSPPLPAVSRGGGLESFATTKELSLKEISRRAVLEAERQVIVRALEHCRWNRVKTAKMLKISYRALLYKIKDMGLKQDSAAS
ncbi:MAG TPA: sigma-54 dependent transcriptional regulator [Methylomirabilota bacterium]|jgi:two-component system response regulator AtoC|nr:sigma-54 dependent transcriptional regulator [Methylomirabilota bacterium]